MLQENGIRRGPVQQTYLYDPAIGFLYATDLFEKDLYREKILESRPELSNGKTPPNLKSRASQITL